MRLINRAIATIISLVLIAGAATGIIYLVGLIANSSAITEPISGIFDSVAGLSLGTIQAIIIVTFIVSLVLFILEVRPWRAQFITISDSESGKSKVFRSDIETYLADRLAREQRSITPRRMEVVVRGEQRFNVDTSVATSTTADPNTVKSQVDDTIRHDLAVIGLDHEVDRVNSQVERVKRAA